MSFDQSLHDALYAALLARDPSWDGKAYVGVSSTGVFCRLTCPARKPKQVNCRFYCSPEACLDAGYRPCQRCSPMQEPATGDPIAQALLATLRDKPDHRWTQADLIASGFDPTTVRRCFLRHFGQTFLTIARTERLRRAAARIASGNRVIDAQLDAGFGSASGFRTAFAKHIGMRPSDAASSPHQADITALEKPS